MHFEYMRSWLRINCATYSDIWTDEQVHMCFAMLPMPTVTFTDWCNLVYGTEQEVEPKQTPYVEDEDGIVWHKGPCPIEQLDDLCDRGVFKKGA